MKEVLDELTRWGQKGYAVNLYHGHTLYDGRAYFGWTCTIQIEQVGSVYHMGLPVAIGAHFADPIEAAKTALRQSAEYWPEMVKDL